MLHNQTACEELLNQHHAPSGGGKFYMSAICIQTGWRAYKKKVYNYNVQYGDSYIVWCASYFVTVL